VVDLFVAIDRFHIVESEGKRVIHSLDRRERKERIMVDVDTRLDSDESGSENEEIPKIQRTARLRKSCELCRTQKARCISSEGADRCQRYVDAVM
jgi:hypothetical protein